MKPLNLAIWMVLMGWFAAPLAASETPVVEYKARLGAEDHVDASGRKLSGVAKILLQDRINVHVHRKGDSEDEVDSYFADKHNRRRLGRWVRASNIDAKTREAIEKGTPLVQVRVYKGRMDVKLLETPQEP